MKVKELIAQLQKLDPELEVLASLGRNQSVVNTVKLVRAPDHFELADPLFVQLRTL